MGNGNTRGARRSTTSTTGAVRAWALGCAVLLGAGGAWGQSTFTVTGPASITETDENQNLVFTVTRSGAALTAASTTVNWAITHDGTDGTSAADFAATSGSVAFAAGDDTQQFLLIVVGDNAAEADEGFELQVSSTGHSAGTAYDGAITEDDIHFAISGSASILEDDTQIVGPWTVTRTGAELAAQFEVRCAMATGVWALTAIPQRIATFEAGDDTQTCGDRFQIKTYAASVADSIPNDGPQNYEVPIEPRSGNTIGATFGPAHQFTVLDNDIHLVVTDGPASVTETDANAATSNYTITRRGGEFPSSTTVTWTVNHGTAGDATASPTVDADFSAVTGTVTFAAGQDSATFTVTIVGDTTSESVENFNLTASVTTANAPSAPAGHTTGYQITSGTGYDVVLRDDENTTFTVNMGPTALTETDANAATSNYTITRTGAELTATTTSVTWTVNHGTTVAGDFSAVTGSVDFAAGADSGTFTLTIVGDTTAEVDKDFTLTASASGYNSGPAYAVTLADNDSATFTITGPGTLTETDADQTTSNYTITRTGAALASSTTVIWAVEHGTAANAADSPTADTDFQEVAGARITTGFLTFGAGDNTQTFTLGIAGDDVVESAKNFHLAARSSGHKSGAGYDVVLNDDDATYTITAGPQLLSETDANANYTYTITRAGVAAAETVTWQVNHADMGGTEAADFSAVTGMVNFSASDTSRDFTLTLVGDNAPESAERFTLTASATGHPEATPYTVAVNDDDTTFTITAGPTSITETNSNQALSYTVTRSGPPAAATITWTVEHGQSADDTNNPTVDADFSAVTGTLNFGTGDSAVFLVLTLTGDSTAEELENFHIALSGPAFFSYGADYDASITDDDGRIFVINSAGATSIAETDANAATTYTISRTGADLPSGGATITWTLNHGTIADSTDSPTVAADFTAVTGTVTFAMADTSQTFDVTVVGDNAVEPTENFHIVLSSSLAEFSTNNGYDVAITNDDTHYAITAGPASIAETDANAASQNFTVTRTGVDAGVVSVTWTINHGTAADNTDSPTAAADFNAVTGSTGFSLSDSSVNFTITVVGDNAVEMTENFNITLSGPAAHSYGAAYDSSITDDDTGFTLSGPTSVTETDADQDIFWTVTRTGQNLTAASTLVVVTLNHGTAADPTDSPTVAGDFSSTVTNSLTFEAGHNSQTFGYTVVGDNDVESTENFHFAFDVGNSASEHEYGAALDVTITDDDAAFTITAGPTSIDETDANVTSSNYTITRTGAEVAATVAWQINHGTVANATDNPTSAADFTAVTGNVTFGASDTTQTFTITVVGENDLDGDKNFNLTASATGHPAGTGYNVALNDDEANFTLTVEQGINSESNFGVEEGAAANMRQIRVKYAADDGSSALAAEATVTANVAGEAPGGINVATSGYPAGVTSERAASAADFAATTSTCTIPANTAHDAVVLCELPAITDDTESERSEHFSVELSDSVNGVQYGAKRFHFIRPSDVIGMRITAANYSGTEANTVDVTVEFSGDATTTVPAGVTEFRLLFDNGDTTYRTETPGTGDTSLLSPTPIWARAEGMRSYTFSAPANADDSDPEVDEVQTWRLRGTLVSIGWNITGGDSGDDGTFTITFEDDDPTSWTMRSRGGGTQNENVNEDAAAIASPTTADTSTDHDDTMYFRITTYEDGVTSTARGEVTLTYCLAGTATGATQAQITANPNLVYDYTYPAGYDPTSTSAAHSAYQGTCTTGRGTITIAAGDPVTYRIPVTLNDDNLNEASETIIASVVNVVEDGYQTRLETTPGEFVATRTIVDNDAITVSIANGGTDQDSATGFQVQESTNAVWVVTLSKPSAADASIPWSATGFEAADTSGTDPTSPLTITAGQTTGTITFALAQDDDDMSTNMTESVTLTLGASPTVGTGGGTIARSSTTSQQSATQIIIPRNIARDLTLTRYMTSAYTTAVDETTASNNVISAEGGPGSVTRLYFDISIGSSQTQFTNATTLHWRVNHAASTGTSDGDFSAVSGMVTHPASNNSCGTACQFSVTISGDNLNEDNEMFTVEVSASSTDFDSPTTADGGTTPDSSAAITITDDDAVQVTAPGGITTAVSEGGNAEINLSLGVIPTTVVAVAYTVGSTSATDDVDATSGTSTTEDFHDPGSGSITFTNTATGRVTFPIRADNLNEGPETFTVTFSNAGVTGEFGSGVVSVNLDPVTFTIGASDPITASIAADAATVQEGGNAEFTVTLAGASAGSAADITVPFTVGGVTSTNLEYGTATLMDGGSGTLTISAGDTTGTITLEIVPSGTATMATPDETLTVTLTAAAPDATPPVAGPTAAAGGGAVARSATVSEQSASTTVDFLDNLHTITITTPDPPGEIDETDSDANTTYTIAHSSGRAITTGQDIVITWAVSLGTASAADFTGGTAPAGGTLTFSNADSADKTFDIGIAGDQLNEAGETFTLTLSIAEANTMAASMNGGVDLPAALTVTIADDDPVVVAVTRASGTGAVDEDSGDLSFTVTLTGGTRATGVETIVPFSIGGLVDADFDISAPSGIDATALGGSITIASGATTGAITVALQDNAVNEAQKTLELTAAAAGDAGLRLSGSGAGGVEYGTGGDMVSVDVADDDDITVTLTRADGATGAVREGGSVDLVATLTRTDGGAAAVTSAADICVGVDVGVTFQQTSSPSRANDDASGADIGGLIDCDGMAVTLPVATSAGTGGINIPAGQSSATLTLSVNFDSVPEGMTNERLETEIDTVTPGTGAGTVVAHAGLLQSFTVNIQNVDAARSVTASVAAATVQEGGTMVFSVTVTGRPVVTAFPLTWTIAGVEESDVSHSGTGLSGTVSFTADADQTQMQSTQTQMVSVTAVDDTLREDDEMLTFTLTAPPNCGGGTDSMCDTGGRPGDFSATAPAIQVSTDSVRVTIAQNDQPITLAVSAPAALTEGTAADFTVSFPESITTTENVTVDWTITFPTAAPTASPPVIPAVAADFMAASGNATIAAGESSATISVTAVADMVNEAIESFSVTLSNPDGGGPIAAPVLHETPSADGTVAANDPVEVRLSRTQADPVVEGGDAEFTVSLVLADGTPATSGGAICVSFGTEVGNQQTPANDATSGADIAVSDCAGAAVTVAAADGTSTGGGVLIAAGQGSATLSIATRFDSIDEGNTDNEELDVTLSGAAAATGAPGAGAGTVSHATGGMGMATAEIRNVNSLRTLAVSGPAAAVDEDSVTGAGQPVPVQFTITMNGTVQPETPVEVRWQLNLEADGSISLPTPPSSGLGRSVEISDVSSPQSGTVTFGTGVTFPSMQMVTVNVQQDALNEGAETLRLVLDPVDESAGGQPRGPDVPGTRVIQDRAEAMIAASDDITVFLTANAAGTVTSGDDALYTMSFGTTTVSGAVVPIVPTTEITVPLMVTVGGQSVTVPDVVVQPGTASMPVTITAAQIDAQTRGGGTAMIMVEAQAPTGAPTGAMARVAETADLPAETMRRNLLSPERREQLGLEGDAATAPPMRQVAGWTVAVSQPSDQAPEGSDWQVVFTLGGDRAALGGNTITVPWSLAGRAIGSADAAVAADFADGPDYNCGANAEGVCSALPSGSVTFRSSTESSITVAIRVRDDGVAEGDDPQGFSLTLGSIGGTAAAQTVTTGTTTLQAAIPALRANLTVADATAAEGQSAEFVLSLSGFNGGTETTQSITVAYMLTDGPATGGARSGDDFTPPATPAEVTDCPAERICTLIPSGARDGTTHRISVPLILDGVLEPRETFTLTITHALRGGGNIQLVADAANPAPVAAISATGAITDDADQSARRNRRVSALVTLLDRQTANLATDAISARLSKARTGGAQSAQLSLANRNLLGAAGLPGEDAANAKAGARDIGLALYGASGYGAGANLPGGAGTANLMGGGAGTAFGGLGAGLAGGANMGTRTALPSLAEVLNGSSFSFDAAGLMANLTEGAEVWGRGGYAGLRGEPEGSGLSYEGKTVAAFVGADTPVTDRLLAGLAIGYASGDLDFTDQVGAFEMKGILSNDTLSVHPYFGWQLGPQSNAWLVLGAGTGSLEITENEGSAAAAVSRQLDGGDTAMRMLAAGISQERKVGETGDVRLRLGFTRVQSRVDSGNFDDGALLPKVRGRSLRLGAELEVGRSIAMENGVSVRPFGTLRFRLDKSSLAFADEPKVTDQAIDWGAGLQANWAEMGLDGRVAFNRQLTDTGHEEQRFALDVSFVPGAQGQGIAVSLQTSVEQRAGQGGGVGELFGRGGALSGALNTGASALTGAGASAAGRQHSLSGEIAYGVAFRYLGRGASRSALLTPYGRFDMGDADTRWAAGLRFAETRSGLTLGFEAGLDLDTRASGANAAPRYDLLLTGSLPF